MNDDRELLRAGVDVSQLLPRMVAAVRCIAARYDDELTSEDVASASGYTKRGLQDAFARYIGMTPTQLRFRLQLEKAKWILQQDITVARIADVAAEVGMGHAGRFSVRYRELFGETPTQTLRRANATRQQP